MKHWNAQAIDLLKKQSEQSRAGEPVSDGNGFLGGVPVDSMPDHTVKVVPVEAKVPIGAVAYSLADGQQKLVIRLKRKRRSA